MARPRMRPAFRITSQCSNAALQKAIAARLDASSDEVVGTLKSRHCVLEVVARDRRYWTPSLDLMFDENAEADSPLTNLWGTFSPRAEIWTALVFTFGTLAIASFFATVIGLAQWALGHTPTALVVPTCAALIAGLLYLGALVGQGLSIAEMYTLRAFLDDCLRDAERRGLRANGSQSSGPDHGHEGQGSQGPEDG